MGESTMELLGHKRKVMIIVWHPIANNILISAGYDNSVCAKKSILNDSRSFTQLLSISFR